jgi:hypothetical protein
MKFRIMGLKLRDFYLDREFYTVKVIDYLQNREYTFILCLVWRKDHTGGYTKYFSNAKSYSLPTTLCVQKKRSLLFKLMWWLSILRGK